MKPFAICATVVMAGVSLLHAQDGLKRDLEAVVRQGRGTAEGRQAWERVKGKGPQALLPILDAMSGTNTSADNWLRTAFDGIVEHERKRGGERIDADALARFARDAKKPGRARRLALDLVEQLRPGTSQTFYADRLDDPEFRFEAVALLLERSRELVKLGRRGEAGQSFRRAFDASRDVQQARDAAAGLQELGANVSVAKHLGFLTDWYLIGPFDGKGMKGFHTSYPPEQNVDLKAELQGQSGKLPWKRYQVKEPPPTSGGRHQALVNLREKDALGDADDAVAFAYTEFEVERGGEVELRGAADDNFTVWVNGAKAFAFEEWRNGVRHDRHRFRVNLRAGKNAVLVKICQTPAPNPEPNWEFFLRVVDETGKGIPTRNTLP